MAQKGKPLPNFRLLEKSYKETLQLYIRLGARDPSISKHDVLNVPFSCK